MKTPQPKTTSEQLARNARIVIVILVAAIVPTIILFGYLGTSNSEPRLLIIAAVLAIIGVVDIAMLTVIQRGRTDLAMMVVLFNFLMVVTLTVLAAQGLGVIVAGATILTYIAISTMAMSRKYSLAAGVAGITFGAALFILDTVLKTDRLAIAQLNQYTPYIVALMAVGFSINIGVEFRRFSLRAKVALGILLTGAVTVVALGIFGISRINLLLNNLTKTFEENITVQIESRIIDAVEKEAHEADSLFIQTLENLTSLADYRERLENQQAIFSQGTYWNALEKVFQLSGGQYGNSTLDTGSVYIPRIYTITEEMIADLNTTAYLDFAAPDFLSANPQVVAVYYISQSGATTYYPNINLAQNVPPDFDVKSQPFFTIAAPQNNPERVARWTQAYQDPAGTGLITTLSIPVYTGNQFKGVMSADLQLTKLSETISNINMGSSGFAFLVDASGHIIVMPEAGYSLFGMVPEVIEVNETPAQTIINKGPAEIQQVIQRLLNGESGLVKIELNGIETYAGFTTLKTSGYRLVIITPATELTSAVAENRLQIENESQRSLQAMFILLFGLFLGGLVISLGVGEIITRPLIRLTQTAEQIGAGQITARAKVETQDETGILAATFNSMAESLNHSLAEMEQRVSERTLELELANERNLRRAAQFEAIARVAHAISSTQTLDALLPQITETISAEFGFYHVGIFLMDKHREYAILAAANSEGGKRMLARNHRLQVGETGIVGYVTHIGQPRVALDVGQDAVYFNNPDLPNTHSEIALPLRVGSDIFGALDVQSTETNAFSQEDINILSTLADQVSIAIQNARSYQQSVEALAQAEKASTQLSGQQWKQFLTDQTQEGFFFDGIETKAITSADKARTHDIAIPLILRGRQIGAIKLNALDPNREWSDDEIAMIQAAADRTALALENARLLFESQKRASKERTIGEISAKIGSLTNIESILQTAVESLGSTLPGVDVAVQFTDPSNQ